MALILLVSARRGQPSTSAVIEVLGRSLAKQSRAAREFFDRRLSYAAIGRASVAAYERVLGTRNPHA